MNYFFVFGFAILAALLFILAFSETAPPPPPPPARGKTLLIEWNVNNAKNVPSQGQIIFDEMKPRQLTGVAVVGPGFRARRQINIGSCGEFQNATILLPWKSERSIWRWPGNRYENGTFYTTSLAVSVGCVIQGLLITDVDQIREQLAHQIWSRLFRSRCGQNALPALFVVMMRFRVSGLFAAEHGLSTVRMDAKRPGSKIHLHKG